MELTGYDAWKTWRDDAIQTVYCNECFSDLGRHGDGLCPCGWCGECEETAKRCECACKIHGEYRRVCFFEVGDKDCAGPKWMLADG